MATGRTTPKNVRCYLDEFDMSGYSRSVGPLSWVYEEADLTCQMSDAAKGYLPGQASISPGTLNGVFDNTATVGLHVIASSVANRILTIPIGIRAAPAAGDPAFVGRFVQLGYNGELVGPSVYANIPFGQWDVSNLISYDKPWASLIHPKGAETAVNTAVGIDDYGSATALGGYMVYHVVTANGTLTIKVQDAAINTDISFADITGATTGVVDFSSGGSGIVAIGTAAAVRRYLRWQIVLGTTTTCTFILSWVRR